MKIPAATITRKPLQVEMTPMIDVVFLLLIFFLWTTSFRIPEERLPSHLAEETMASGTTSVVTEQIDFDPIVIRIGWQDGQPNWRIGNRLAATVGEVSARLSEIARIKRDVPVIVDPADNVPLGHLIDVYDMTRQVGFETVQFAAAERGAPLLNVRRVMSCRCERSWQDGSNPEKPAAPWSHETAYRPSRRQAGR